MTIYVRLMGGLGNQLFQVAAAMSLVDTKNEKIVLLEPYKNRRIKLDEKWFSPLISDGSIQTREKRFYRLENYILKRRLSEGKKRNWVEYFVQALVELSMTWAFHERVHLLTPKSLGFEEFKKESKSIYLNGYFQTYRYVVDKPKIVETLRDCLNHLRCHTAEANVRMIQKSVFNIALHIRLGDYLLNPQFGNLDEKFFENSLQWFLDKKINAPIYLYSDDVQQAMKVVNFLPTPPVVLDECKHGAICALWQMTHHTNFILSNSTFGWWAAFFSLSEEKAIHVPSPWFKTLREPNDLCPESWKKITSIWHDD